MYLSVEVPTSTMGEKGCWDNFECLAESMFYDFSPINNYHLLMIILKKNTDLSHLLMIILKKYCNKI